MLNFVSDKCHCGGIKHAVLSWSRFVTAHYRLAVLYAAQTWPVIKELKPHSLPHILFGPKTQPRLLAKTPNQPCTKFAMDIFADCRGVSLCVTHMIRYRRTVNQTLASKGYQVHYSAPNSHFYCSGAPNEKQRGELNLGIRMGTTYFYGGDQESIAGECSHSWNNWSVSRGGISVLR